MPRVSREVSAVVIEILRGDIAAHPRAEHAATLLPAFAEAPPPSEASTETPPNASGDTLTLACTDADMASAYRVLRTLMDFGYEHPRPACVRLICADDAVCRTYRFQWNMWYAAHKPEDRPH